MKAKQPSLFEQLQRPSEKRDNKRRVVHGGQPSKGKRKLARPLSTKKWIHLVLKSDKATGKYSLRAERNLKFIEKLINEKAKKFGVELKEFINMGNHLHMKIRISSRKAFQSFLRAITNEIPRHVTGARRGVRFGRFWQGLAYTRVIESSLELAQFDKYLMANKIEAKRGYRSRKLYLDSANRWISELRTKSSKTKKALSTSEIRT